MADKQVKKTGAHGNAGIDAKTPGKPAKASTLSKATDTITDSAKNAQRVIAERTDDAVRATTQTLDANPLAVVAGALAVGAVAAALLPTTRRELETLGPVGDKIRDAVTGAVAAAREAGTGELTAAGLTFAAATDGLGGIAGKIAKAASVSASAAAGSVRKSAPQQPAGGMQQAAAPVQQQGQEGKLDSSVAQTADV